MAGRTVIPPRAGRRALLLALVLLAGGCGTEAPAAPAAATPPAPRGPTGVRLRPVPGVPRVPTGPVGPDGHRAEVACSTCHSLRTPSPTTRSGDTLVRFHREIEVQHGSLTCLSCHHPDDYDALRLADGRRLPFAEVMTLCAQCHGPQARDYAHGAHGGMSGAWDPRRGEQVRNQCTHCHAPHRPAYPTMRPTFKPRDRFLPVHTESDDD